MNVRAVRNDVLDWRDRTFDPDDRPALGVILAAIVVFLLWVIGQVFVGDPAIVEPVPAPSVYVHPEPTP